MMGRSNGTAETGRTAGQCLLSVAAMVLALMATPPVDAQVPIQVLDLGVGDSTTPDIAFDHDDQIVVSYRHAGEDALKLARGSDCTLISTLYDLGQPGRTSSVAIDSLGFPNIVHFSANDMPGEGLRYTLDGGALFGVSTVNITPDHAGYVPVFDLDSVDRPFVVYRRGPSSAPWFAFFDIPSGQWASEVIPGPDLAGSTDDRFVTIATDSQDRPVVAYFDTEDNVVVATLSAGGWSFRSHEIGSSPSADDSLSLAFDTVDAPHVTHAVGGTIEVLRFGILSVDTQTATTSGSPFIGPHAMAIDAGNHIRIVYADASDQSLYLAKNEYGWSSTLIEAGTVDATAGAAVALDSQGRWAVAYYDAVNDLLKAAGPDISSMVRGDLDCDGDLDIDDTAPFVLALLDASAYAIAYEDCDINAGDFNCDGLVDGRDIQPFVRALLTN